MFNDPVIPICFIPIVSSVFFLNKHPRLAIIGEFSGYVSFSVGYTGPLPLILLVKIPGVSKNRKLRI